MIDTNFNPFPTLATERLVLRQLEKTDAGDIFAHRNDDIVNTYLDDFRHATIDVTHTFISRVLNEIAEGKTILWVLTEKGNNKFIGTVCLWNISKEKCTAEAGYVLDAAYHGKGYMNEALVKIIDFGFNKMKLKSIDAYTHENNNNSIQLLQRNNFKQGIPQKEVPANRVYFLLKNDKL